MEKHIVAEIVTKLKAQWLCKKELPNHGSCVDARSEHIQLTVPRLEDWAKSIVSLSFSFFSGGSDHLLQNMSNSQLKVDVPPPDDVLDQWNISQGSAVPCPCSHGGPHLQPFPGLSTDAAQLSLATVGLLMAITGSITHHRSLSPR